MKKVQITILVVLAIATLIFYGCTAVDTLATGVSQKSISGSGTLISSRVGLDTTTQTPELYNLFVWGDYTSVVPGDEIVRYEETEDASIFNSDATTRKVKILFASGDKERVDAIIEKIEAKISAPQSP